VVSASIQEPEPVSEQNIIYQESDEEDSIDNIPVSDE